MAFVKMYKDKLEKNYQFLQKVFGDEKKEWAVVTKLLCGSEAFLREVLSLGISEVCDARISNLKTIKKLKPDVQTVYIKPPAKRSIKNVIKYADVSFNTELKTIEWLSDEAVRQKKTHKIIIMIELGDLREGVMGEALIDFYAGIFRLPNIEVTGVGTNLNCLHGVMPSEDKLIQLCLYKQLIEAKFNRKIPWVTGGTSVVVPLLMRKQVPAGVNHFRIGETLFFGNDLVHNTPFEEMEQDVFELFAEIIEITEKPKIPIGTIGTNPSGEEFDVNEEDFGKTSYRAIIDLGVLDVSNYQNLIPKDPHVKIIGASSDMLVLDLGNSDWNYKVGDLVAFEIAYMEALRLFNSDYIEKVVERKN
ncbi:alanine/ornithine racemase family PLP-dependent enzyme [bacterium]|nr:alanine/ornithine racemase family PLP-dependent enzyme [bacterium]